MLQRYAFFTRKVGKSLGKRSVWYQAMQAVRLELRNPLEGGTWLEQSVWRFR
jgi:hypothetical protein